MIYRVSAACIAVQPDYVVDGKPVASAQPNGFVMCHLSPGRHEVAVDNFPISFTPFSSGSERLTVNLRAGGTIYLAAAPQMGTYTPGKITLKEVAKARAAPKQPACIGSMALAGRADVVRYPNSMISTD